MNGGDRGGPNGRNRWEMSPAPGPRPMPIQPRSASTYRENSYALFSESTSTAAANKGGPAVQRGASSEHALAVRGPSSNSLRASRPPYRLDSTPPSSSFSSPSPPPHHAHHGHGHHDAHEEEGGVSGARGRHGGSNVPLLSANA